MEIVSTTKEVNTYSLPFLCTWGSSQSAPRKIPGAPGLAALQTNRVQTRIVGVFLSSQIAFSCKYFMFYGKIC